MCAESRVDNIRDIFVIAEQCLHIIKAFSASAVSGLGKHQKLGEDTAEIADPNWPNGYLMPYDIMLSIQSWGKKKKEEMVGMMVPK